MIWYYKSRESLTHMRRHSFNSRRRAAATSSLVTPFQHRSSPSIEHHAVRDCIQAFSAHQSNVQRVRTGVLNHQLQVAGFIEVCRVADRSWSQGIGGLRVRLKVYQAPAYVLLRSLVAALDVKPGTADSKKSRERAITRKCDLCSGGTLSNNVCEMCMRGT